MAANQSSGKTGHVPTGNKKHKKGPVDRFHGWSPEHQAKVLQRLGITSDEFAGKGRGQQRRLIRRSHAKAQSQHAAAQQKRQQANDPAYFTQPLTQNSAGALADQMTNLKYGTAESQLQTRQAQVAPWFQNYQAQIGAAQQAVAAQNAPIIGNAQAQAQNTGQTVLKDVDPGSDAAHNDTLAAAARQALGNAFASQLNAQQQAANTYFGQQQSVIAPQYQQSVSTGLANQASDLAQEKGAYRASTLGDLRDKAHTQNLENQAFNVDTANTLQDNTNDLKKIQQDARKSRAAAKEKGQTVNAHGYTAKAWNAMSVDQRRKIIAADKKTGAGGAGGGKDAYGNTPKQSRAANSTLKKAKSVAGQIVQKGDSWKDVYNLLIVKYPTGDSDTLKAAAIMAVGGRVGPKLKRSLIRQGINPALIRAKLRAQVDHNAPGTTGNTPGPNGQYRPG